MSPYVGFSSLKGEIYFAKDSLPHVGSLALRRRRSAAADQCYYLDDGVAAVAAACSSTTTTTAATKFLPCQVCSLITQTHQAPVKLPETRRKQMLASGRGEKLRT